jgi:hypothetical protein
MAAVGHRTISELGLARYVPLPQSIGIRAEQDCAYKGLRRIVACASIALRDAPDKFGQHSLAECSCVRLRQAEVIQPGGYCQEGLRFMQSVAWQRLEPLERKYPARTVWGVMDVWFGYFRGGVQLVGLFGCYACGSAQYPNGSYVPVRCTKSIQESYLPHEGNSVGPGSHAMVKYSDNIVGLWIAFRLELADIALLIGGEIRRRQDYGGGYFITDSRMYE